jgi:hypothetical protein
MDLRLRKSPDRKMSEPIRFAFNAIREVVPYHADDHCWGVEIDKDEKLIIENKVIQSQ